MARRILSQILQPRAEQVYVRMDGTVYPCVNSGDLLMGDLTKQDPEEVWFGKRSNELRRTVRATCEAPPSNRSSRSTMVSTT